MRSRVDEIRKGDKGCGEPDDGAVERDDKDLGMGVEGAGDIDIVGDEAAEDVAASGGGKGTAAWAGGCYVCAAVRECISYAFVSRYIVGAPSATAMSV